MGTVTAFRFYGDEVEARKLIPFARKQLAMVRNQLSPNNLAVGNYHRIFNGGVEIYISSVASVEVINIYVPFKEVKDEKFERRITRSVTRSKKYYPALQVYNSQRDPYSQSEIPYGDHDPWIQPTKVGLLVSMTEGSFNGPYRFIPLKAEEFTKIYYYSYNRDAMDWTNGTIPPFWYEQWRYHSASPPADLNDWPSKITVAQTLTEKFSVMYQPRSSYFYASYGDRNLRPNNNRWSGGGSLAAGAYERDANPNGGVWNEAIWWEGVDAKMLFRVMRTRVLDNGRYTSMIARQSPALNFTPPADLVFEQNETNTGWEDISYETVAWQYGGTYDSAYSNLETDVMEASYGAREVLENLDPKTSYLRGDDCVLWHRDTVYDVESEWLEYVVGAAPDDSDEYAIVCGVTYEPTNTVKVATYDEGNKDLYWSNKPYYPSSLYSSEFINTQWPASNYLFMNGKRVELECGAPDWWAEQGMLWALGAVSMRYYNTDAGPIALTLLNDYPSSPDPYISHVLNYVCIMDKEESLQATHGPRFDHNDPGVQGLDYYGPDTYFDNTRHQITDAMREALPEAYSDCIWGLGEYRLLEVEKVEETED